jgi:Zn-dependent protease
MNLLAIAALIPSIILHELGHGYMALRAGDDTAKRMGRLSFNPISHIDLLGSIIIPGMLILSGAGFIFGYAKPVPINPSYFVRGKRDLLWVALAGPLANIALLMVSAVILKTAPAMPVISEFLGLMIVYNFILAIFNLIPFPPLDGSRILDSLLPPNLSYKWHRLEPYGLAILFIAMLNGWIDGVFRLFQPVLLLILRWVGA